jgi:putative DNA primase/helicase
VTTAAPTPPRKSLAPGEIRLDYLPVDFPLTPLKGKKAYLPGWTSNSQTVSQVKKELDEGRATGVGLLCGQWSNELALIFVDIDGADAIPEIEKLGGGPLSEIFPRTLTISSGKEGKLRMLFRVPPEKVDSLPDKATLKVDKHPWEILWRSRQGALMGAHPDTEGYRTTDHGGFEYAKDLPEMPQWLYDAIEKAYPHSRYRRKSRSTGPLITQSITINYDEDSQFALESSMHEAVQYLEALNPSRADSYEDWIAVGMSLHQIADEMLPAWVDWSSQSSAFEQGVCEDKWANFERLPGGPNPDEGRGLKTLRAMAREDGYVDFGGFTVPTADSVAKRIGDEQGGFSVAADGLKEFFEQFGRPVGIDDGDDDEEDTSDVEGAIGMLLNPFGKKRDRDRARSQGDDKGKGRTPPASEVCLAIQDECLELWRYDARYDSFLFYEASIGIWRMENHRKEFHHYVQCLINDLSSVNGYSNNYVSDVCSLLEGHLIELKWKDTDHLLAFRNGVLDLRHGDFFDHSKDHYITWGLDFDYNQDCAASPITEWLYRTQYGDEARVNVLRAWLRACLVGRGNEIQRFLEVIGPGGRGKSTFANLCCALVGIGNYASTTLNQLEQSRFELASIKGKRLTLINDSERYGGSAQVFKALTGGDNLRYEEKMKSIGDPFVYNGMVMVVANEPIQTTDNTSGLSRRRLTVEFNRKLYEKNSEAKDMIKIDKGHISGLWKDYLPGLVNWVLAMTEEEMRQYLLDTNEMVPALRKVRNNILLNSNNLVEWLQAEIVVADESVVGVGKKIPAAKDSGERYNNSKYHLYPSYCSYCEDTGSKPVGQKRFIALLLDCCKNQLDLPSIRTFTKGGKPFIKGLAIRSSDAKYEKYQTILPEGAD